VTGNSATTAPHRTGWTGLVWFAAFMMLMLGTFQAIQGLAAVINDDFYTVSPNGMVLHLDYSVWGWAHLLLGVAIFLAGVGVLSGNVLARTVGVVLAILSAIVNLLFAAAAPGWAILLISLDVLVIYALTVHGREMADTV
jgi:hypothetical protein